MASFNTSGPILPKSLHQTLRPQRSRTPPFPLSLDRYKSNDYKVHTNGPHAHHNLRHPRNGFVYGLGRQPIHITGIAGALPR